MLLEIRGHHLPGRSWHGGGQRHDNVHVGVQVRRDPAELVPGDAASVTWRVPVEVVGEDFRGPAVQGRRGERFVYLTWGEVGTDDGFTMFRRAKLVLADVLPHLTGADATVVAEVDLTDERGAPRCARLRAPALVLRAG